MKQKLPLLLTILFLTTSLFSQEKDAKTYWYTSSDTDGYISVQKIDAPNKIVFATTLNTTVKTTFNNRVLDFSLSTINATDKMVTPLKIVFEGTVDPKMKPVRFTGTRIKKDKKDISYWSFDGDFIDELEADPDFKRFSFAKYSATLRIPERTIPSFNLWAIIPNLPFDRKGTFKFNILDETNLFVKKNQTVNYLGYTKISVNGKKTKLHKFAHQGKGMQPEYYWVNEARELVQVLLNDKYTFTISTKENALKNLTVTDSNK